MMGMFHILMIMVATRAYTIVKNGTEPLRPFHFIVCKLFIINKTFKNARRERRGEGGRG